MQHSSQDTTEPLLTAAACARRIGLKGYQLTRLGNAGKVTRVEIGGQFYYRLSDVRAAMHILNPTQRA
jgi:hypothetical protein